jgi:chemosensory pili system protein ChpA (sensor histidine kinase/response regulator)
MSGTSGQSVLVVHDEPAFTDAVSEVFRRMGLSVEIAVDPGEAVRCLLAHAPDVVCINLNLPRGSGYELCELIRGDQSFQGLPIVLMSDRHSPEDITYAEEAGANVFLHLPSPSKSLRSLAAHLAPLFEGRAPQSAPDVRTLRPTGPPPAF